MKIFNKIGKHFSFSIWHLQIKYNYKKEYKILLEYNGLIGDVKYYAFKLNVDKLLHDRNINYFQTNQKYSDMQIVNRIEQRGHFKLVQSTEH